MVEQAFAMAEASIEAVKKDPPTAETNTLLTSLFNTVPDENGRNDVGKALILGLSQILDRLIQANLSHI